MTVEVRLDKLDQSRLEQVEDLKVEWFIDRLDDRMKPVGEAFKLEFVAEKYTNVVSVRGKIVGAMACQCSRCGDDIEWPVVTLFEHRYVSKGELLTDQMSEQSAEEVSLDVSEHDGSVIDLAPIAIEQMLVELPYAPTCPNPESSGCAKFGDAPMEYGDTEPLEPAETSWNKALKGLDPSKLKDS